MSTDGTAFDQLGRILAEGGLASARAGLDRHEPGPLFLAFLARRFPSLGAHEVTALSDLAQRYRTAGNLVSQMPAGHILSDDAIPVVPQLFPGGGLGQRYQVIARILQRSQETGTEKWVTATISEPFMPSIEDLQTLLNEIVSLLWKKYKEAKLLGMEEAWDQLQVEFVGVARSF